MSKYQTLLSSGWYHCRIRQSYIDNNQLHLTWTVDRGSEKWRNLVPTFTLDEVGLTQLEQMCKSLGKVLYPNTENEFFTKQFLGWRGKLKVDRVPTTKVKKNIIMEYALPELPEEVNVMKEKSDGHFYSDKPNKRKLPIQ